MSDDISRGRIRAEEWLQCNHHEDGIITFCKECVIEISNLGKNEVRSETLKAIFADLEKRGEIGIFLSNELKKKYEVE